MQSALSTTDYADGASARQNVTRSPAHSNYTQLDIRPVITGKGVLQVMGTGFGQHQVARSCHQLRDQLPMAKLISSAIESVGLHQEMLMPSPEQTLQ